MLNGSKITLRLTRATDLPALYVKWHDAEARGPYYPLALVPEPIFQKEFAKNGFWSDSSQRMLIVDKKDKLLGMIHCFRISYADCMEISYFLFDETERNKGYATQAVTLIVDYLFSQHPLNRIQMCIPKDNKASIRVAEKSRFVHEGVARGSFLLNGEYEDLHIYSLLRSEWKHQR